MPEKLLIFAYCATVSKLDIRLVILRMIVAGAIFRLAEVAAGFGRDSFSFLHVNCMWKRVAQMLLGSCLDWPEV